MSLARHRLFQRRQAVGVLLACVGAIALPSVGRADPVERVEVRADHLVLTETGWRASGSVSLRPVSADLPWVLTAESVELRPDTLSILDPRFAASDLTIDSSTLTVNLADGHVHGGRVHAVRQGSGRTLVASGERFTLTGEEFHIVGADVSPCSCSSKADGLRMHAESVRIGPLPVNTTHDNDPIMMDARSLTLGVGSVPLIWLPALSYPVSGRRSGLTPPEFGYYGDRGSYVGLGGFWAPTTNLDLTPGLFWLSRGSRAGASGRFGSTLRMRRADLNLLGSRQLSTLELAAGSDGGNATPSFRVGGAGSLATASAPDLRWRLALRSSFDDDVGHRAPLNERLGGAAHSAVALSDVTGRSSFGMAARAIQPLERSAPLWSGQSTAAADVGARYGIRFVPLSPVSIGLWLAGDHIRPFGRSDPAPATATVLTSTMDLTLPVSVGVVNLTLAGASRQLATVHDRPLREDEVCVDAGACVRSTASQRSTVSLSAAGDVTLVGTPLGVHHTLTAHTAAHAFVLRRDLGPPQPESLSDAVTSALPAFAAQLSLDQRLGRAGGAHGDLSLGITHLRELGALDRPALALPVSTTRLLGDLRVTEGVVRLSAAAEISADAGDRLNSARAEISAGDRVRVAAGLAHLGRGWRSAGAPEVVSASAPPHFRARPTLSRITGATLSAGFPLPLLDSFTLSSEALVPVDTGETHMEDAEVRGTLRLGELAGCLEVGVTVAKRAAPSVTDVWVFAVLR